MITADAPLTRRHHLLELFSQARQRGVRFARISEVDQLVAERTAAWFLKHDVHGLRLESLLEFAQAEKDIGVFATYLFMDGNHPVTQRHYTFDAQVQAMRRIQAMGHEVGLHIDPLHLIHDRHLPLRSAIVEIFNRFAAEGISFNIGNAHGNTKFNIRDRNGHSSLFEFFEELGRQRDFPVLANLGDEAATLVRSNRVSITDLGFVYWADMPMWSHRNRYIVTHYLSDNMLDKQGTLKVATLPDTVGRYKLLDWHPPTARLAAPVREVVACEPSDDAAPSMPIGAFNVAFDGPECRDWFSRLAGQPVLVLIHPEHYC